jgi:outer membrane lipoprotein SlyB
MSRIRTLLALPAGLLLASCASMPSGPSVMVLPGSGKSFEQFRADDYQCRQFAIEQAGGSTPNQASATSGVASAAIGTGLGAAAGAAIGGGTGAAIGAGGGLLGGSLVGAGTGRTSGYITQQRYDMGYIQCMYANGHRVPVSGRIMYNSPASSGVQNTNIRSPSQPGNAQFQPPPPPPGNPPPPPPR